MSLFYHAVMSIGQNYNISFHGTCCFEKHAAFCLMTEFSLNYIKLAMLVLKVYIKIAQTLSKKVTSDRTRGLLCSNVMFS